MSDFVEGLELKSSVQVKELKQRIAEQESALDHEHKVRVQRELEICELNKKLNRAYALVKDLLER